MISSYLLKRIKVVDMKTVLELFMLLSLLVVWSVWPLRGTIAARNIALVSGALASAAWLSIVRPKIKIADLLPIGFLLLVPTWLLGLYIFNPVEPNLQFDELRGTWLRVFVGLFLAFGLGKIYMYRPQYRIFFLLILFIWPVVILGLFVSQGLFTSSWFGEQFYIYVFKSKVAGVYFLIWSLFFVFSCLHLRLVGQNYVEENQENSSSVLLKVVGVLFLICIINFFFLSSLNAFIVITIDLMVLAYFSMKGEPSRASRHLRLNKFIFICLTAICLITAITYVDARNSNSKLRNVISDLDFIVNYDVTGAWRWDGSDKGIYPPINSLTQRPVSGSTYERVSWFREGLVFLKDHPSGLGYTGNAFSYYMRDKYPGSQSTKTHSGWLDFGLGAGVVGVLFIWLAMGVIYTRACVKTNSSYQHEIMRRYLLWSLPTMLLLWSIAELSDREFIEHFFCMLVFFSSILCSDYLLVVNEEEYMATFHNSSK